MKLNKKGNYKTTLGKINRHNQSFIKYDYESVYVTRPASYSTKIHNRHLFKYDVCKENEF